jgi:hypothetical protein
MVNSNSEYENNSEHDNTKNKTFFQYKKPYKKAGRTLCINNDNMLLDISVFDNMDLNGLLSKTKTINNKTIFLVFDNIQNALTSLKILKSKNFRVRFSYYKLFFTFTNYPENFDYNEFKNAICSFVTNKIPTNILYCKLYCKNNNFLSCGDLTVDTLDDMISILSKESDIKDFKFDNFSGSFYKFNSKKKNI